MKENLSICQNTLFFNGINQNEIEAMLHCLSAYVRNYKKDEYIIRFGDSVEHICLVLDGAIHIGYDDFWGNTNIVTEVSRGDFFAETLACINGGVANMNAIATLPSKVMFMNAKKIFETCSSSCIFHTRLIRNILSSIAEKNMKLSEKHRHITQRSTRDKLLSYLSSESKKMQSAHFEIPFNRQQLANYLSVERSAMSNELSKMQHEGILEYEKNRFSLKEKYLIGGDSSS